MAEFEEGLERPDYEDSGSEYQPSHHSLCLSPTLQEILNKEREEPWEDTRITTRLLQEDTTTKPKKRLRKTENWTQKRFFKNIYVPEDWEQVILAARKTRPFKIISMNKDLFFSSKSLEKNITNRKICLDKGKVEWLKMQWIMYCEMHPVKLYFKYSNNNEVLFREVDLKKRNSVVIEILELLYPTTNAISEKKKKDLIELLNYIPPFHHNFYNNLKSSATIIDEIFIDNLDDLTDE